MVFYFSGTGNSLWVAKQLAEFQGEQLVSIAEQMKKKQPFSVELKPNEKLGFVFPVYAWAPPKMVMQFIQQLELSCHKAAYTFAVCTCGDTAGHTMNVLDKALRKKNLELSSGFSVFMPNNYIVLYDVDSKEVQAQKLEQAKPRVAHINQVVLQKQQGIFDCHKGSQPFFFTHIVSPVFNKAALGAKKFYAKSSCTSCGLCGRICPTENIVLENGLPKWSNVCTKCLACFHRCPVRAIEYGKASQNKGRYYNPNV